MFTKLIFHLRLSGDLPDVLLQESYIHSTYVIYLCVLKIFNVLILKIVGNFSEDVYVLANLLL